MAALPTQTFTQLVRGQVAAIQGAASGLIDFTVGSILRAIVESCSQVVLWLQGLVISLLATTRFATSVGPDADSWAADFDFSREDAAAATTQETFGRFSPTLQGVVSIGATVETQDGSQQYVVIADASNPNYSAALGGYVLAPGVATVSCPIQASVAGAAANAAPGAINTITSAIPGIDYCTNAEAATNGADQESDAAFRARFVKWINSLSRAIKVAVEVAAQSIGLNIVCRVIENYAYDGTWQPGYFQVIVDDGSGDPPASTLTLAAQAVEGVRGLCVTYGIFAPVVLPATVTFSIGVATGYSPSAMIAAAQNAVASYMDGLQLGDAMPWSRIVQVVLNASPGVSEVSNLRINGGQTDLAASDQQV
ncbi:MAG TPA: baseplate J/gp47 family protein, partial [Caulobacteraceae bacterium]|nr:baseplate J/gp47 family protein [Caulobacteraceae bacterium]